MNNNEISEKGHGLHMIKQKVKQIVPLFTFLFFTLFFLNTGITARAANLPSAAEASAAMMALQAQYPEGTPWTNDNTYKSRALFYWPGSSYGSGVSGSGCVAFALMLSDAAYGDAPMYETYNLSRIHVGDIIRMNNDTHSVVVIDISGNEVTIAEGNYMASVHWGRKLNLLDKSSWNYIWTRFDHIEEQIQPEGQLALYRLYNPNSGEHFYTNRTGEGNKLVDAGWEYEGVAWIAPVSSGTPVHRLYNPNSGEHHYTENAGEKDSLVSIGWRYEGIGWYSDDNQGTPLYRLYNPNATGQYEAGGHHYTKNVDEKNDLIAAGWRDEGIGWYGI